MVRCGPVRLCAVHAWPCVVLYGSVWFYVVLGGPLCSSVSLCRPMWFSDWSDVRLCGPMWSCGLPDPPPTPSTAAQSRRGGRPRPRDEGARRADPGMQISSDRINDKSYFILIRIRQNSIRIQENLSEFFRNFEI